MNVSGTLRIEKNAIQTEPVILTFDAQHIGVNAKAAVIEVDAGVSVCFIENTAIDSNVRVIVGENSAVEYVRYVQAEQSEVAVTGHAEFEVRRNARLNLVSIVSASQKSRTVQNLNVNLVAEGAEAAIDGVYRLSNEARYENHSVIHFKRPHTKGSQLYKGVLSGESRAVFDGMVKIDHGCDKASSEQLNRNLIMDSRSQVSSRPQLQIYTDDVKATHGSTVGNLSEDEIFYLQSRAISRERAQKILAHGFVSEIVYRISNSNARDWALNKLETSI